jgi:rSAM/selenodomain-associated transferase 2
MIDGLGLRIIECRRTEGARIDASRISIVIPALNERDTINDCIAGVRRLDGGRVCEVVVVDGDVEGSTLDVIEDTGVIKMTAERGRSRQMNAGAAAASGQVLVFLHADTKLPTGALLEITRTLEDPTCVGGAFAHRFDSDRFAYRLMSACVSLMTSRTRLPYGDQALFLRRNYFESIGAFAPIDIMEDFELVRRIRRRGDRLAMLRSPVHTSCRRMQEESIVRRVVTNWMMCALFTAGVSARRLARHYRPHGEHPDVSMPPERRPVVLARPPDNP